jgi:hypothetical protein
MLMLELACPDPLCTWYSPMVLLSHGVASCIMVTASANGGRLGG